MPPMPDLTDLQEVLFAATSFNAGLVPGVERNPEAVARLEEAIANLAAGDEELIDQLANLRMVCKVLEITGLDAIALFGADEPQG